MPLLIRYFRPLQGLAAVMLVLSWQAAQGAPASLTPAEARHLLVRSGFAPDQAEVDAIAGQPAAGVVVAIIAKAQAAQPVHAPPAFVSGPPATPPRQLSEDARRLQRQQQLREGQEMKAWWVREMIETPAPLKERMTLFWHNHFATSLQKVNRSQGMWAQQQLLRVDALGNFRTLVHGVAKDPAMLVYLDGAKSKKEAPNENFAREVMELFTLGEASQGGNYTERDIREAARAFTGWSVEPQDFSFRFRPAFHDTGNKTLLGKTGKFDGDGAIDILLDQPAAARFIVGKLWKEFISPTPDAAQIDKIAERFRSSDYNISVALQALFMSDAFWALQNRGTLVKSPVDLVVGTLRQFNFTYIDAMPFALKTAQLGQNLLIPPNVKGWPGQNEWITSTTLLERKRFTEQLFRVVELKGESKMAALEMSAGGPMVDADAALPVPNATMHSPMQPAPDINSVKPVQQMRAEFAGGTGGAGGNRQALALLGRDGLMRVADGLAQITFDPTRWLAQYGGVVDREPSDELKARLAQTLLAVPPTQVVASGTVGVAYLRSLTLDPAYQLK